MRIWIALTTLNLLLLAFLGLWVREARGILLTPPSAWMNERQGDCAIALTGGAGRTREGLDLLARGQIQKLILAGVHPDAQFEEIFPQWPFYRVDRRDVVLERRSTTTYGNAHQSLAIAEALGCRSVLLVTSRLHMARAMRVFEEVSAGQFKIYAHAVVSNDLNPEWTEVAIESFKSLFYDVLDLG